MRAGRRRLAGRRQPYRWFARPASSLLRVDYALYYASALQGRSAGWHRLYDLDAQRAVFRSIGPDLWWFPNVYSPALSLLIAPLSLLPLHTGYLIWSAILLASVLACWHLLAPGDAPARAIQFAMFFVPYPVMLGLNMGQVIALQMAALAGAFVFLQRGRDAAAGVALAVVSLKPQGLILVPLALLAAGKPKLFASWAACMAAIGAVMLAVIGADGAAAYAQRLLYAQSHPQEFWVNWAYTLPRHFESAWARALVQIIVVVAALVAAYRHRRQPGLAIAAGLLGSLLATPFVHLDDFMLLFPAAWLTLRVVPRAAAALVAGYALLVLCGWSEHIWGRGVLLFESVWLAALALAPPQR